MSIATEGVEGQMIQNVAKGNEAAKALVAMAGPMSTPRGRSILNKTGASPVHSIVSTGLSYDPPPIPALYPPFPTRE